MCGIAGCFGPNAGVSATSLVKALHHRGPDGSGIWQSVCATLVHTRLAIIDLSEAGKQPMEWKRGQELVGRGQRSGVRGQESEVRGQGIFDSPSSDVSPFPADNRQLTTDNSSYVLVFNGEIYNYLELRNELEAQGESFVGQSDTEVLLRLLVREGEVCLPKLAGMFAFAFWDEATGSALLARDPLGIKPLYYRQENGTLSFASEARVLRKTGDLTDPSALRDFFLWGSVPEPATLNGAVRQLPAGHWLKWKDGHCAIHQWHADSNSKFKIQNSKSPAALTREALLESMRRHLVSDVPVGIFLSGGIDSTVILALTREVLGPAADIRTFSIGFDDPGFDESGLAKRTAAHFGASHTEWKMTPAEGSAEIPAYLAAVDQPTIDGFNTWCVSKLARREGVKVVLSGLGGDEIFAGYASFDRVPKFHAWHRWLGPLRGLAACLLETRPHGTPWRRLAAFLRGKGSWLEAYHVQRGIFTAQEAEALVKALSGGMPLDPDWKAGTSFQRGGDHAETSSQIPAMSADLLAQGSYDPREVVSHLEITRYMRNQLLRDSDVFSMAHGLELRVPFVDQRFLTTLQQIPAGIRLRQGKLLLLDAVREVPEWIRSQPKHGFRFPFQIWMEGQFGDLVEDAQQASPVPLNAWYRTWAVAAAMNATR